MNEEKKLYERIHEGIPLRFEKYVDSCLDNAKMEAPIADNYTWSLSALKEYRNDMESWFIKNFGKRVSSENSKEAK